MTKTVLIVEDDKDISGLLEIHLRDMGFQTTTLDNGGEVEGIVEKMNFDIIILDIMLPEKDGLEVCKALRANGVKTPILMLTARSEEIDKILGLEMGADDYLTKPFSIRELIARIKAILRRIELHSKVTSEENLDVITIENMILDLGKRKLTIDKERIDLTPKEFDLLALLASHPGKNYTRERLLSQIWGYEFEGYEHTVNSHINRLRVKIEEDLSQPKYILTSWGVGYRFNDELSVA